jgi:hypothetical protein
MLPGQYLGLGWLALSLPIMEIGIRGLPSGFRKQS